MVSSCCCSCWAIIPKAKPASVRRVPSNAVASSTSRARPRTSAAYRRASAGDSSGRLGRSERGCSKASYRLSISGRIASCPATARSSHCSSWLPMCARSHTSGDISGDTWAVRSGPSTQLVSSVVRARAVTSVVRARSRSFSASTAAPSPEVTAAVVSVVSTGSVISGSPSRAGHGPRRPAACPARSSAGQRPLTHVALPVPGDGVRHLVLAPSRGSAASAAVKQVTAASRSSGSVSASRAASSYSGLCGAGRPSVRSASGLTAR
ncbi:hypothetical protein STENM36S_00232 [Streptomyces tendae]